MAKKAKKPTPIKTRLRSAIRKVWLYSPLRREALAQARVERGKYQCSKCSKVVGPKEVEIDHKIPATPPTGLNTQDDWGYFIWNLLFIPLDRLEALCKDCHKAKTDLDRKNRKKL